MSTPTLLSSIPIGNYVLNHRIVYPPMTRLRNTENGIPQPLVVEYYKQRATNGGLLIAEGTVIAPTTVTYKGAPGIYSDEQIEGWKKVVDAVHAKGALIFSQLWHVGRATSSKLLPDGQVPVSASPIAIKGPNMIGEEYEVPRELTVDEIKEVIQAFVVAAKNAIAAGFDGVEIHGANGYLVDQFINTSSNVRSDDYGGSIANRARFALELTDAVVEAIGVRKVAIRLSPWSEFQDMKDDTPVETWSYITQQLQLKHPDLAYIHFIEARESGQRDEPTPKEESLDPFREIWKGPFITAGGYLDGKTAIQLCEAKPNNLVAFGRMFIANPDLVERIRNDWPLNKYNRATFYTPGPEGYTDYPFYSSLKENEANKIEVQQIDVKENGEQENAGQENGEQENGEQENVGQENGGQENEGQENGGQENGGQETGGQEIEVKEIEAKEIEAKEIEVKEIEAKQIEAKEIEAKEIEAKEIEVKEIEAKQIEAKEIEVTEIEVKEIEVKEIEVKEIEVKENGAKEIEAKGNGSKKIIIKESVARESVTADPILNNLKGNVRSLMKNFQLSK